MKSLLLNERPYTVTAQKGMRGSSLKIVLSPICGFAAGEKVYEVRRDDGTVELIPEKIYNEKRKKTLQK